MLREQSLFPKKVLLIIISTVLEVIWNAVPFPCGGLEISALIIPLTVFLIIVIKEIFKARFYFVIQTSSSHTILCTLFNYLMCLIKVTLFDAHILF
jgi:hypothetical protein